MYILRKYTSMTILQKVGLWGAIASIAALMINLVPHDVRSQKQESQGGSSPNIINKGGEVTINYGADRKQGLDLLEEANIGQLNSEDGIKAKQLLELAANAIDLSKEERNDIILGKWKNDVMFAGFWEIIKNPNNEGFLIIEASDYSLTSNKGEAIGEFNIDESQVYDYRGRHKWGRDENGPSEWGINGGLSIKIIDDRQIHARYLDSIYSDGWIFTKVK